MLRRNLELTFRDTYYTYRTAKNQDERDAANRKLLHLSRLAGELYGFEFQDELQQIIIPLKHQNNSDY